VAIITLFDAVALAPGSARLRRRSERAFGAIGAAFSERFWRCEGAERASLSTLPDRARCAQTPLSRARSNFRADAGAISLREVVQE
jgi:hypothetical protein